MDILNKDIKNVRNVKKYTIGNGSISGLSSSLDSIRNSRDGYVIFFIDEFFENKKLIDLLNKKDNDQVIFVETINEPTTEYIDKLVILLNNKKLTNPSAIVGIGGGITMDVGKAISNMLTNGGKAADYQGWDLVKSPGIYKIGIPTISGTGSEATRTCVMTNKKTGLKLGMNSDYTVYDQLIMDPELTKTVPRNQFFYTGMDAYIHCIEAANGLYRNPIGDAYSEQTISLCKRVFSSQDMMTNSNRELLMVASYLGGCSIATSYVGVVHPFSAGLSVVFGIHHCEANCITMRAMEDFYPKEFDEFWQLVDKQKIIIPSKVCANLTDEQYIQLYNATIIHEKPLSNALGKDFKKFLTLEKVTQIFKKM